MPFVTWLPRDRNSIFTRFFAQIDVNSKQNRKSEPYPTVKLRRPILDHAFRAKELDDRRQYHERKNTQNKVARLTISFASKGRSDMRSQQIPKRDHKKVRESAVKPNQNILPGMMIIAELTSGSHKKLEVKPKAARQKHQCQKAVKHSPQAVTQFHRTPAQSICANSARQLSFLRPFQQAIAPW